MDFTDDVVSSTITFYFEKSTTDSARNSESDVTQQKTSQKIIELVKENANISTQEMAERIGIDRRNVTRAIHKLREAGIIHRVGPDKGGHWEIIPTD